jgi:hypothetical protein
VFGSRIFNNLLYFCGPSCLITIPWKWSVLLDGSVFSLCFFPSVSKFHLAGMM